MTKYGILGSLILFCEILYKNKILDWVSLSESVLTMKSVIFQDGHRVHTSNITFVISQLIDELYKYTFGNQTYVLRVHESNKIHFSNIGP